MTWTLVNSSINRSPLSGEFDKCIAGAYFEPLAEDLDLVILSYIRWEKWQHLEADWEQLDMLVVFHSTLLRWLLGGMTLWVHHWVQKDCR